MTSDLNNSSFWSDNLGESESNFKIYPKSFNLYENRETTDSLLYQVFKCEDSINKMSTDKCESSQSSTGLNDSWVELNMSTAAKHNSGQSTPSMEKLLMEAQKESGLTSRNSSGRNSSKAMNSPPLSASSGSSEEFTRPSIEIPQEQLTEFIKDWSSRPEIIPPSEYGVKLSRPVKRHPLSIRNTRVMKDGWLSSDNLPTLLVTHAASFVVGASLVIWYFTKSSGPING